jgi:hypothetical protein
VRDREFCGVSVKLLNGDAVIANVCTDVVVAVFLGSKKICCQDIKNR